MIYLEEEGDNIHRGKGGGVDMKDEEQGWRHIWMGWRVRRS